MSDTPSDTPAEPTHPRKQTAKKKAKAKAKPRRKTNSPHAPRPRKSAIDPETDPWCGLRDERHVEVAERYLADPRRSQTDAYLAAYPDSSRAAAQVSASRLFASAPMRRYLEKRRKEIAEHLAVTPERVLDELAKIAFADPGELVQWGPDGVELRPSDQIPRELRAVVAEVSTTWRDGQRNVRIKFVAKTPALDLLGRALDLWREAKGDTGPALIVNM